MSLIPSQVLFQERLTGLFVLFDKICHFYAKKLLLSYMLASQSNITTVVGDGYFYHFSFKTNKNLSKNQNKLGFNRQLSCSYMYVFEYLCGLQLRENEMMFQDVCTLLTLKFGFVQSFV